MAAALQMCVDMNAQPSLMHLTPGAPRDTTRWRPSSNCPNLESGVERGRGSPGGPVVCVPTDEDVLGNSN